MATSPELCLACQTWHPPPKCSHDAEAPCRECGGKVGYRFFRAPGVLSDADRCWACWWREHSAE